MHKKLLSATLAWLLLVTLLPAATLSMSKDKDKEKDNKNIQFGLEMPATKPDKPLANYDENFRKAKRTEEFFELRGEVLGVLNELTTLVSTADEKELRRNQAKIVQLIKKYKKNKNDFFREAKKLRQPWDKEYDKYVTEEKRLKALSEAAAKKGDDKNATKFEQQIAKFTGKMESLKTNIDIVNFYLFFDEEEVLSKYIGIADTTNSKDKVKQNSTNDDKDDKKTRKKKNRKQEE